MRKPNFSKLSTEVLLGYKADIDALLKERKTSDEKKNKLLKKVKILVESEGLSMDDLLTVKTSSKPKKVATKKATKKVLPKYANPKDKTQKWSGRGRKPLWVAAHIKKGGKMEDLFI